MMLTGDRIKLRAIEPEDIEILFNWENNTKFWVVSNTVAPYSKHLLNKYIESSRLDIYEAKQLRFVVELIDEKKAIGLIDLFDFDPFHMRAGVGILIAEEEYQNKGYAKDALELLEAYAFEYLQLKQLYCNITTDNVNSIALFSGLKYVEVGTKKAWLKTPEGWKDETIYQKINSSFDIND